MKTVRFALIIICATMAFGCVTPRLGFPEKSMEIPVPVTLFSNITPAGVLDNKLGIASRELWETIYRQKFIDMFAQVNTAGLKVALINPLFMEKAVKTDLFKIEPDFVLNLAVEYIKTETDPASYSGFNFNGLQQSIPTRYILAFTVDEWGYRVSNTASEDGPFMVFAIRLIDKENSNSVWEFKKRYQGLITSSLRETKREVLQPQDLEDAYRKLIQEGLADFFNWLNSK